MPAVPTVIHTALPFWALSLFGIMLLLPSLAGAAPIPLPPPAASGPVSVEAALQQRRTVRHFAARPLTLVQVAQLAWAASGVSDRRGLRTAPSAGALYPLDLYLVVGERQGGDLAAGVYHYLPDRHALQSLTAGDQRAPLARACLHQAWMAEAPVIFVLTGEYARCTRKYGDRGIIYTHMESGHAAQNLCLQAVALGLGAGIVGAFDNRAVSHTLGLPASHDPLLVLPVGHPLHSSSR